jgi:hypothetical protein
MRAWNEFLFPDITLLPSCGSTVVEALCYKLDGHGFKTDEVIAFDQFAGSFWLHWALGIIKPLKEISARNIKKIYQGSRALLTCEADNLSPICKPIV